jgi:hypothetical protein
MDEARSVRDPQGAYWYAAVSFRGREEEAQAYAEGLGLLAYVPMRERRRKPSRHVKAGEVVLVPVVSGVVFVGAGHPMTAEHAYWLCSPIKPASKAAQDAPSPDGATRSNSQRSWRKSPFAAVHGSDGVPSRVGWREIMGMVEANRDQEKLGEMRQVGSVFAPGAHVALASGPLQGVEGYVIDGLHGRLSIMAHILGTQRRVDVAVSDVLAAE